MFTEEILEMLFEETGEDFATWAASHDYTSMSDQEIYAALPSSIIPFLGDFGLNASWMHDGM